MRDRDVIVSNFWLGMLLSVLAHLFLLLVRLNSMEFQKPQIVEELLPIEITELTKIQPKVVPKKQEKQIVETERDGIESLDKDAKFMSDINQKVEKETRAKMIDDFRKKSGTGLKKDGEQVKMAAPPSGEAGKPNSDLEVDDRGGADQAQPTGIKRNWQTLSLKDLSISGDGGLASASDGRR